MNITPTNDGCETCKYVRTEKIGNRALHLFVCSTSWTDEDGSEYEDVSCVVRYGEQGWEYTSWPTVHFGGDIEETFRFLVADQK